MKYEFNNKSGLKVELILKENLEKEELEIEKIKIDNVVVKNKKTLELNLTM
ncbi:hypothetical protein IC216_14380 [Clostridioides sp. ES-S-0145-01]|uniref:hypothetical protein n=1 Tax=Clostridioides sp. ES-S-0145-01 TaxID=2770784 RepID=UPI001D124C9F|nr:hypothetical protein [Clostridioides sp. ES-S-0145-01]